MKEKKEINALQTLMKDAKGVPILIKPEEQRARREDKAGRRRGKGTRRRPSSLGSKSPEVVAGYFRKEGGKK